MIFVTVGSQKFQFDRLLREIDSAIEEKIITEPVFAQIGSSTYIPKHYEYSPFLDNDDFIEKISKSNMIISHGGTGSIINSLNMKKKVIAVARLSKFGEHVDDHQLQIVDKLSINNYIIGVKDVSDLKDAIMKAKDFPFNTYNNQEKSLIKDIDTYLINLWKTTPI